jgi:glycosyltransferase involved in cell wall biosynthesis
MLSLNRAGSDIDLRNTSSSDTGNQPVIQAVLYTNPDRLPPAINTSRVLARAGFSLNMICRDYKRQWDIDYPPDTKIRRIKKQAGASWGEYASFIAQSIRFADKSAVVVVGHEMHGLLPAWLLATLYRRPLIYHCHDFVEGARRVSFGARVVRALERRLARTADLVIVPDVGRAAVIARELRLTRPPLVVANAPLQRPDGSEEILHDALRRCGLHFEATLLRQGTLGPGHGIEATIRSIPYWSSKRWGFVVMGFGEQQYLDELRALAGSLTVENQFAILPPVSYDDVARYTVGADVGHALYDPVNVNHTYMGTASNKVLEFMAAGLPVLVPHTESFRLFHDVYKCAVGVDESSPTSIANGVNTLLGSPELARSMGDAGTRAFEQVFCYERQFAPVLQAIRALSRSG